MLSEEMGLDAEVVRVCAWKGFVCLVNISSIAITFFASVSYRCVKSQPCVSATLFLLFLLYVCYPCAFWILVYSSPIAACIYILLRKKLCSRFYEVQVVKQEENRNGLSSEKLSSAIGDRTFKLNGKTILSRRSRKRIILQSADSNDPTNRLFAMLANPLKFEDRKMNVLCGGDHSSLNSPNVDELYTPTGDRQDSEHCVSNSGFVTCDGFSESLQRDGHFEPESPDQVDNDDEDETEDANKGLDWTEDDQKDLMDLGNSDIERNKRLESLMVKRRVKKLSSMQLQREPSNFNVGALSKIDPIAIGKSNLLLTPRDVHGSEKLPGSAPSVLVPMRNPFDLPYDPQEERPDLTGDSFGEEFMLADLRDLNLSQHESFDLKSKFPGEPENIHTTEKQESEGLSCLTFESQQDNDPNEKLFQASLSIEDESMPTITNDVKMLEQKEPSSPALSFEKIKVKDNEKSENVMLSVCAREQDKVEKFADSKLADSLRIQTEIPSSGSVKTFSTLYSPSEDEEVENRDQDEVLNGPDGSVSKAFIDSLRKSLIRSRSRIIARGMIECLPVNQSVADPDSSPIENTTMVEDLLYEEKQNRAARTTRHSIASDLQVEVSDSSPPLTLGTISPPDGEFLNYDADIEKEIISGSEDMWGASSHLSAVEENESRSRVVHEISEYDIIGLGFCEVNQSEKDLTASEMSSRKVERQDSTFRNSLALGTNRSMEVYAPPASITTNILDEIPRDVSRMPLSHIVTDETFEKNLAPSCGSTQESAKLVANDDSAKEVCDPLLKCNGMSDMIQNGTHMVVHGIEQAYRDNDDTFSRHYPSKADEETLNYVNIKSHSGGPEVLDTIQHKHDMLEDYCISVSYENFAQGPKKHSQKTGAVGSDPYEVMNFAQNNKAFESSTEVELLEVNRNCYNATLPAMQSELLDGQVPVISSTSLSSSYSSAENVIRGHVLQSNVQQPAMNGISSNEISSGLYLIVDENKRQTEGLDLLTIPSEHNMKEPINRDKEKRGNITLDVLGDSKASINLDATVKLSSLAKAADTAVIKGEEEEVSKAFVSCEGNASHSSKERNSDSLGAEEPSSIGVSRSKSYMGYEPVEHNGPKKLTEAKIDIQDEPAPNLSKREEASSSRNTSDDFMSNSNLSMLPVEKEGPEKEMEIPMRGVGEELKDMMKCEPTCNFAKLDEFSILVEDEVTSKREKNLGLHLVEEGPAKETDARIALQVVEIKLEDFTKVNPTISLSMPEDGNIVQNGNANVKAKLEDSMEPKVAEKDPSNWKEATVTMGDFEVGMEYLIKDEPTAKLPKSNEAFSVQNANVSLTTKRQVKIKENTREKGQSKEMKSITVMGDLEVGLKDSMKDEPAVKLPKSSEASTVQNVNANVLNQRQKLMEQKVVEKGLARETEPPLVTGEHAVASKDEIKGAPEVKLSQSCEASSVRNLDDNETNKKEDNVEQKLVEICQSKETETTLIVGAESEALAKGEPEVVLANSNEASNVQNVDYGAKVDENIDEKLVEDGQSKHLIADAFAEPSKPKEAGIAKGSNEIKMNEKEGSINQKSVERKGPSKEMETTTSMQDVGGESKDLIKGGPLENLSRPKEPNALCPLKEVDVTTAQRDVEGVKRNK